jgi:flavin reductase (DIM6/NTAB) family NADH-FMN oxidoreductase RutF
MPEQVNITDYLNIAFDKCRHGGLLITAVGKDGKPNAMTIGWWLFGPFYHGNDMSVIAVCPPRYTFKLLEEVGEYVVVVPTGEMAEAVAFCGSKSGRDYDKFAETGLVPVASCHVKPPSVKGAILNIECRIYHKERPPHMLLTPEHRQRPVEQQHTIYFSEVLGAYVR